MVNMKIFVLATYAVLVCANEAEENEQKKRGTGKTTSLNAIPSGAQKPDYTYSIYSQSPGAQSPQTYQNVPNSFYPTQSAGNQYYQTTPQEQPPVYSQTPQINLLPPPNNSPFVPLNFVPNAGYQAKYQIIPSRSSNGNIQLAILQPQSFLQQSQLQNIFSQNPSNHIASQQSTLLNSISPQLPNYQFNQPYQSYLGQPSTAMVLLQPNPSLYNNLLYPNAGPSLYNYYQPSPQAKYNLFYGPSSQANQSPPSLEYDKLPPGQQQSAPKEDNEISALNNDYLTPAESNSNYKNAYAASRTSYKN